MTTRAERVAAFERECREAIERAKRSEPPERADEWEHRDVLGYVQATQTESPEG